jgi:hypothetical protein
LKHIQIQARNGFFVPFQKDIWNFKVADMGLLMQKNELDGDMTFTIMKPVELLHDINAYMWLKCSVQYRYPQDVSRISAAFPHLIQELTQEKEYWREAEPIEEDETITPNRLGDKEMYVPCICVNERWGVEKGVFQFTIRNLGLGLDFGTNQKNVMFEKYGVSFVNYEGREFFAVYRTEDKKRYGKATYAHCKFYKFIPLSKVLAVTCDDDTMDSMLRTLNWACTPRRFNIDTH